MSRWVLTGLRTGIKTSAYPRAAERAAGVTPGRPLGTRLGGDAAAALAARCAPGALVAKDGEIAVDYRRCVHCYRCVRATSDALPWEESYEWAGLGAGEPERGARDRGDEAAEPDRSEPERRGEAAERGQAAGSAAPPLALPFRRSVHILVVDAGDCGACLNEVRQLNNPYYNMHRLGFFVTPTPRHADVLLVVGPVTDQMRGPLEQIYAAMPAPKRVVAAGACALSGGVFADSFVCAKGVGEVLPVDVEVPGNPPPPLAILHALLVVTGRKAPVPLSGPPDKGLAAEAASELAAASAPARRPVGSEAATPGAGGGSIRPRPASRR